MGIWGRETDKRWIASSRKEKTLSPIHRARKCTPSEGMQVKGLGEKETIKSFFKPRHCPDKKAQETNKPGEKKKNRMPGLTLRP